MCDMTLVTTLQQVNMWNRNYVTTFAMRTGNQAAAVAVTLEPGKQERLPWPWCWSREMRSWERPPWSWQRDRRDLTWLWPTTGACSSWSTWECLEQRGQPTCPDKVPRCKLASRSRRPPQWSPGGTLKQWARDPCPNSRCSRIARRSSWVGLLVDPWAGLHVASGRWRKEKFWPFWSSTHDSMRCGGSGPKSWEKENSGVGSGWAGFNNPQEH